MSSISPSTCGKVMIVSVSFLYSPSLCFVRMLAPTPAFDRYTPTPAKGVTQPHITHIPVYPRTYGRAMHTTLAPHTRTWACAHTHTRMHAHQPTHPHTHTRTHARTHTRARTRTQGTSCLLYTSPSPRD